MEIRIEPYAKKTFAALKNPYGTVTAVHPKVIDLVAETGQKCGGAFYTGIKDTEMIPAGLMKRMESGGFLEHTRDRMSLGGRAVDLSLVNPLTGRWMTGSSSGTALNVFYGINDLGIGTDGGGSVLAPAAALNLFGFLSPLIEEAHMRQYHRMSTDKIAFSPSIGFISRDWQVMRRAVETALPVVLEAEAPPLHCQKVPEGVDIYGAREDLMPCLQELVRPGHILISDEGPVDVQGMGDTVYGHFDAETKARQRLAKKGLMRVVNMCGKSALVIPKQELAVTTLLICDSNPADIRAMLDLAETWVSAGSELTERYFMNLDMYF